MLCLCTPRPQEADIPFAVDHAYQRRRPRPGNDLFTIIGKLNAKGIVLNRKVMADLAMNEPKAFEAIVKAVK